MSLRPSQQPPERDPETVAIFLDETAEALQRLETSLLAAERGSLPDNLIQVLFRDLHTLKGNAGYLSYDKSRALSHAAEDLLGALRERNEVPGARHVACLLAVGDRLRNLVDSIRDHHEEGPVDVDRLIAELRGLQEESGGAVGPQATSEAEASGDSGEGPEALVRVHVSVLNSLMSLVGELVLARNELAQRLQLDAGDGSVSQTQWQRLNLVTAGLQQQVMRARLVAVARLFEKLPRMARDVARATGKQVVTQIEESTAEIDRALVESVRDPLMHMVRNAVDHGIEPAAERLGLGKPAFGTIRVRAFHLGGTVTIEVQDDGRGMDPARLRDRAVKMHLLTAEQAAALDDREALGLVFHAGFSTATTVTDISGRGVGMDVVRSHVEQAGGQVNIESTVGVGTTVRLKIPLTLAIVPALMVTCGGQRFAIAQVNLLEIVHLDPARASIEMVRGAPVYRLRGELLPLVRLGELLGLETGEPDPVNHICVLSVGARSFGLVVGDLEATEEIVVKPLHGRSKRLPYYSGATVLGDGSVTLILDAAGIAQAAGIDAAGVRHNLSIAHAGALERQAMLMFRVGAHTLCAVPLAEVSRLEQVATATVERLASHEVWRCRDVVMPVIRPEALLCSGEAPQPQQDKQAMIVFDYGRPIAVAVSEIYDVVESTVSRQALGTAMAGTLGSAIVADATCLLIDAPNLVRALAPQAIASAAERA